MQNQYCEESSCWEVGRWEIDADPLDSPSSQCENYVETLRSSQTSTTQRNHFW